MTAASAVLGRGRRADYLLPPVVAAVGFLAIAVGGTTGAALLLAVALGGAAVLWAARHPAGALGVVVAFVPLQGVLLAALFRAGAPVPVVRNLGYTKEVMVAGLVLTAVSASAAEAARARRPDRLDLLAFAFVAVCTVYLLAPTVVPGLLGSQPLRVRIFSWRANALFVVLFLAGRRIRFRAQALRRLTTLVLVLAIVMTTGAVWEWTAEKSFNSFLVDGVGLPAFRAQILGVTDVDPTNALTRGLVGSTLFVRVGSLLNDFLALGFLMLVPLGVCLVRLSGRRVTAGLALITAATAVTILLTLTRSAILGALLAAALGVVLGARRVAPGRVRLAVLLLAGGVLITPLVLRTSLLDRLVGAFTGADSSAAEHRASSFAALNAVVAQPFGRGLGANPVTGGRFDVDTRITAENAYLQVGAEVGLLAMALFVCMLLLLLARLRDRALCSHATSDLAGALWLAGWGLAVGGFFLHVWLSLPTALTFWGLAGAALGRVEPDAQSPRSAPV